MRCRHGCRMTNEELVQRLVDAGTLRTHRIIEAFRDVDRKHFLPEDQRGNAYVDEPLPIPAGQTNSQPSTVAFMLELLDPLPGERILDVGCGSAWTTALLSAIVGAQGEVIGVERQEELVTFGRQNLETLDLGDAVVHSAMDTVGWPDSAPYHRILVSASALSFPDELLDQVSNGGIIVVPVRDEIWRVEKRAEGEYDVQRHAGFRFVPLI